MVFSFVSSHIRGGKGPSAQDIEYQLAHSKDDRSRQAQAVNIVMVVIAIVAVTLRFISRYISGHLFRRDDWTMLVALLLSCCMFAGGEVSLQFGNGKHTVIVGAATATKFLEESFVWDLLYTSCNFAIKLSILFLYERMFVGYRRFRICLFVYGGFAVAYWVASVLLICLQCTPIQLSWNKTLSYGHCVDALAALLSSASINMFMDLTLFLMPIPLVWNLKVSLKKRLAVSAIFLLGVLVCFASAFRIYYISKAIFGGDPTWRTFFLGVWSLVEIDVGILCACLPIMRPLFRRIKLPSQIGSSLKRSRIHLLKSSTLKSRTSRSTQSKSANKSLPRGMASTVSWPGRRIEELLEPTSPHHSIDEVSEISVSSPHKPISAQGYFLNPRPAVRPLPSLQQRAINTEHRKTLWRRLHPLGDAELNAEATAINPTWDQSHMSSGEYNGGFAPPPVPQKDWVTVKMLRETSNVEWAAGGGNRF